MTDDTKAKDNKGQDKPPLSAAERITSLDVLAPSTISASSWEAGKKATAAPDRGLLFGIGSGAVDAGARMFSDPFVMIKDEPSRSAAAKGLSTLFTRPGEVATSLTTQIATTWNSGNSEQRGNILGATAANVGMIGMAFKGVSGTAAGMKEASAVTAVPLRTPANLSFAPRIAQTAAAEVSTANIGRVLGTATKTGVSNTDNAVTLAGRVANQADNADDLLRASTAGNEGAAANLTTDFGRMGPSNTAIPGRTTTAGLHEVRIGQPPTNATGKILSLGDNQPSVTIARGSTGTAAEGTLAQQLGAVDGAVPPRSFTTHPGSITARVGADVPAGTTFAGRTAAQVDNVAPVAGQVDNAGAVAGRFDNVGPTAGRLDNVAPVAGQLDNSAVVGQLDNATIGGAPRTFVNYIDESGRAVTFTANQADQGMTFAQRMAGLGDEGAGIGMRRAAVGQLDNQGGLGARIAQPAVTRLDDGAGVAARGRNNLDNAIAAADDPLVQVRNATTHADDIRPITEAGPRSRAFNAEPQFAALRNELDNIQVPGVQQSRIQSLAKSLDEYAATPNPATYNKVTQSLDDIAREAKEAAVRTGTRVPDEQLQKLARTADDAIGRETSAGIRAVERPPANVNEGVVARNANEQPAVQRNVEQPRTGEPTANRTGEPTVNRTVEQPSVRSAEQPAVTTRPIEQPSWVGTQGRITEKLDDLRSAVRESADAPRAINQLDELDVAIRRYADDASDVNLTAVNKALREVDNTVGPNFTKQVAEVRQNLVQHMTPEHAVFTKLQGAIKSEAGIAAARTISDDIAVHTRNLQRQPLDDVARQTEKFVESQTKFIERRIGSIPAEEANALRRIVAEYGDDTTRVANAGMRDGARTMPIKGEAVIAKTPEELLGPKAAEWRAHTNSASQNYTRMLDATDDATRAQAMRAFRADAKKAADTVDSAGLSKADARALTLDTGAGAQNARIFNLANRSDDLVAANKAWTRTIDDTAAQIKDPVRRSTFQAEAQTLQAFETKLPTVRTQMGEWATQRAISNSLQRLEKLAAEEGINFAPIRAQAQNIDNAVQGVRTARQTAQIGDTFFSPAREVINRHAWLQKPVDFLHTVHNNPAVLATYAGLGLNGIREGVQDFLIHVGRDISPKLEGAQQQRSQQEHTSEAATYTVREANNAAVVEPAQRAVEPGQRVVDPWSDRSVRAEPVVQPAATTIEAQRAGTVQDQPAATVQGRSVGASQDRPATVVDDRAATVVEDRPATVLENQPAAAVQVEPLTVAQPFAVEQPAATVQGAVTVERRTPVVEFGDRQVTARPVAATTGDAEPITVTRVSDTTNDTAPILSNQAVPSEQINDPAAPHVFFSREMSLQDARFERTRYYGGATNGPDVDFVAYARGPGAPSPSTDSRPIIGSIPNVAFRNTITDIPERERLGTRPVTPRLPRIDPSSLFNRSEGFQTSNSYLSADGRRFSGGGASTYSQGQNNANGAGNFARRYPFLAQAAEQAKLGRVSAATSSGAENNEALNPDNSGNGVVTQGTTMAYANPGNNDNDPSTMPTATTSAQATTITSDDSEAAAVMS